MNFYVARHKEETIGCACVGQYNNLDDECVIVSFCVAHKWQGKGIGKALITAMLERAKQLGYGAILFFGRPEYYPQFGFKEASEFGVADAEGYNYPSFMGMELIPGYLKEACGGKFYESDIYNDELNREAVKAFDEQF